VERILVIQTAFIGDVILATGVVEKLARRFPDAQLDMVVRGGNQSLLNGNPHLNAVLVWDKKSAKYRNLWRLLRTIRSRKYDAVITLQRYASSGVLCGFSGAEYRAGFKQNPLSWRFTHTAVHQIASEPDSPHEVERNHRLVHPLTDTVPAMPRLYPSDEDRKAGAAYQQGHYVCLAPSSVWFTKRWPTTYWEEVMNARPEVTFYLLGAPGEREELEAMVTNRPHVHNLAGELTLLQSAALMQGAAMNVVNDSGPLHLCSAMEAPVTALFCNTVSAFGFGPLGKDAVVLETQEELACRPCGITGKKACPLRHFRCGHSIGVNRVLARIDQSLK